MTKKRAIGRKQTCTITLAGDDTDTDININMSFDPPLRKAAPETAVTALACRILELLEQLASASNGDLELIGNLGLIRQTGGKDGRRQSSTF